ncbi:MAG TPA: TonB family protein [Steroidobacteraceae bacterium]|nr:TonB family protein [Steroidobacteraceae bacterium]
MQSTRHDPTLAALQAGAGLPGHVLDVVLLTSDPGVLATLREAAGPEHAIWHAPSADTAVDLLVGGRCSILVADLGALRGDAANLLDQLHSQFPELILLATGRRDEEHSIASLVSDGRIYRFLHKPVSPARANLFLTAATRRYNELRNTEPVGMTTVKTIAARPNFKLIGVGVVAVLIAATTAFVFWQSRKALEPPPPPRQVGTLTTQEQIADYLARGQMAIVTDRLIDPRGNNAVEYFRGVLALQQDNADAKAGLLRVGGALEARVVAALEARNPAQGAAALMTLQRAVPEYPKLDLLREELLALSRSTRTPISVAPPPVQRPVARAPVTAPVVEEPPQAQTVEPETSPEDAPADTQAPAAQAEAPAEAPATTGPNASELAAIARLRGRGILLEPPGSNAYEQLLALRERYPDSEELRTEQQQLAFAFLERTRTALAAGDVDTARTFLSRADTLVPNMSATKALQAQLATAQQQHDFATNIVPATRLKRVREVPPAYPREAERLGIRGWVDVEFTVAPDGTTQDLIVRNAQPQRMFDQAAVDAVKRWRFEPVLRDGAAVAQRTNVRIRFELQ